MSERGLDLHPLGRRLRGGMGPVDFVMAEARHQHRWG